MRGPYWNNGRTGVTGEPVAPSYASTHPNVQTFTDSAGQTYTRVLNPGSISDQTTDEDGDNN